MIKFLRFDQVDHETMLVLARFYEDTRTIQPPYCQPRDAATYSAVMEVCLARAQEHAARLIFQPFRSRRAL